MEYNFEKFIPTIGNRTQGYRGICVGKTQVSLSSHCRKELRNRVWSYIAVLYDKEKNVIKFVPASDGTGYKVYGQMSIQISSVMPIGRYHRVDFEHDGMLLFEKEII